jgi:hypothetical protein
VVLVFGMAFVVVVVVVFGVVVGLVTVLLMVVAVVVGCVLQYLETRILSVPAICGSGRRIDIVVQFVAMTCLCCWKDVCCYLSRILA